MDKGNNTEIEAATLALTPGATRNHDNVALGGQAGCDVRICHRGPCGVRDW